MLEPLPILLQIARQSSADKPFAFSWRAQEYVRTHAGGVPALGMIAWKAGIQEDLAAIARTPPDPAATARVGDVLRGFLLETGWSADEARIAEAVRDGRSVRVTLQLAAAELFAFPWELLAFGEEGRRLGELPGLELRYEWPGTRTVQPEPSPRHEGGRVLFVWSDQGGPVPADQHRAALEEALAAGGNAARGRSSKRKREGMLELPNATYPAIAEALRDADPPFSVVHLLAHGVGTPGGEVAVALDDGPLDGASLHSLLAKHAADIRMVVLAACRGGDPGPIDTHLGSLATQAHRAGVESVVASRLPLSVEGSITLTRGLYGALLAADPPRSLEDALGEVRSALGDSAARSDAWSIQRYGRAADGPDTRPFVFRPYRGLRAFSTRHRRFFFGRTEERDALLGEIDAVRAGGGLRLHIVEGASGSGKSSLVMAAVVPELIARGYRWEHLVPGAAPVEALEAALARLDTSGGRADTILVIDQLEEVFTQTTDPEQRLAFARHMVEQAKQPGGPLVIATIRSDFKARLADLPLNDEHRMDVLFLSEWAGHHTYVPRMRSAQIRAAIIEPAVRVGLVLDPGLADTIIADVGAEPGALPLLADALDSLWRSRQGRRLTLEAYTQMGGLAGALRRRADGVMERFEAQGSGPVGPPPPQVAQVSRWFWGVVGRFLSNVAPLPTGAGVDESARAVAWRVLTSLVTPGEAGAPDTRRRRALDELAGVGTERVEPVLDRLVAERLLVRAEDREQVTVEVAHEALIRRWEALRAKVAERRELLEARQRMERWVEDLSERTAFDDGQMEFVAAFVRDRGVEELPAKVGKAFAKRTQRRRTSFLFGVVGAGVLAPGVVLGVFVWQQHQLRQAEGELATLQLTSTIQNRSLMLAAYDAGSDATRRVQLLRHVENDGHSHRWTRAALEALSHPIAAAVAPLGAAPGEGPSDAAAQWQVDATPSGAGAWTLRAARGTWAGCWTVDQGVSGGAGLSLVEASCPAAAAPFKPTLTSSPVVPPGVPDGAPEPAPAWEYETAFGGTTIGIGTFERDPMVAGWRQEQHTLLAVAAEDGGVVVYDSATGPDGRRIAWAPLWGGWSGEASRMPTRLTFSPDGELVVAWYPGWSRSRARVARLGDPAPEWGAVRGPSQSADGLCSGEDLSCLSPDGRLWLDRSSDNSASLRLYSATSGYPLDTLPGHTGTVRAVRWYDHGRALAVYTDEELRIWRMAPLSVDGTQAESGTPVGPADPQTGTWTQGTCSAKVEADSLKLQCGKDKWHELIGDVQSPEAVFDEEGKRLVVVTRAAVENGDDAVVIWDTTFPTTRIATLQQPGWGALKTVRLEKEGRELYVVTQGNAGARRWPVSGTAVQAALTSATALELEDRVIERARSRECAECPLSTSAAATGNDGAAPSADAAYYTNLLIF